MYSCLERVKKPYLKGFLFNADIDKVVVIGWPYFMSNKSTDDFYLVAREASGSKKQRCTAKHKRDAETIELATILPSDLHQADRLQQQFVLNLSCAMLIAENELTIKSIWEDYSKVIKHLLWDLRIDSGLLNQITTCKEEDVHSKALVHKAASADLKRNLLTKGWILQSKEAHVPKMIQKLRRPKRKIKLKRIVCMLCPWLYSFIPQRIPSDEVCPL